MLKILVITWPTLPFQGVCLWSLWQDLPIVSSPVPQLMGHLTGQQASELVQRTIQKQSHSCHWMVGCGIIGGFGLCTQWLIKREGDGRIEKEHAGKQSQPWLVSDGRFHFSQFQLYISQDLHTSYVWDLSDFSTSALGPVRSLSASRPWIYQLFLLPVLGPIRALHLLPLGLSDLHFLSLDLSDLHLLSLELSISLLPALGPVKSFHFLFLDLSDISTSCPWTCQISTSQGLFSSWQTKEIQLDQSNFFGRGGVGGDFNFLFLELTISPKMQLLIPNFFFPLRFFTGKKNFETDNQAICSVKIYKTIKNQNMLSM